MTEYRWLSQREFLKTTGISAGADLFLGYSLIACQELSEQPGVEEVTPTPELPISKCSGRIQFT